MKAATPLVAFVVFHEKKAVLFGNVQSKSSIGFEQRLEHLERSTRKMLLQCIEKRFGQKKAFAFGRVKTNDLVLGHIIDGGRESWGGRIHH